MFPAERKMQIASLVFEKKVVTVAELTEMFGVSEMTIRRDLSQLKKEGLLVRTYGGAMVPSGVNSESPFEIRSREAVKQKRLIGKAAAELISSGECIGIDVGTTTLMVAKEIKKSQQLLTVLTSSLPVLNELVGCRGIEVICTGGILRERDKSFVGHIADMALKEFILDKVFIGVAGVSVENGLTAYNMDDALVKRTLISRAREVIIVTDSSKFGRSMFATICDLNKVHCVVTDSGIPDDYADLFEREGVKVVLADRRMEN